MLDFLYGLNRAKSDTSRAEENMMRARVRGVMGVITFVCATASVSAVERVDISQEGSDSPPRHWVVILARPAGVDSEVTPGHAFVEFGRENPVRNRTEFEAWGFYPEGDKTGLSKVPGKIMDEIKEGSLSKTSVIVSVSVTKKTYENSRALLTDWQTRKQDFHLYNARNCVDFTHEMAGALGLERPERSTFLFPAAYVRELGKVNKED
jgi:hypothetical protein